MSQAARRSAATASTTLVTARAIAERGRDGAEGVIRHESTSGDVSIRDDALSQREGGEQLRLARHRGQYRSGGMARVRRDRRHGTLGMRPRHGPRNVARPPATPGSTVGLVARITPAPTSSETSTPTAPTGTMMKLPGCLTDIASPTDTGRGARRNLALQSALLPSDQSCDRRGMARKRHASADLPATLLIDWIRISPNRATRNPRSSPLARETSARQSSAVRTVQQRNRVPVTRRPSAARSERPAGDPSPDGHCLVRRPSSGCQSSAFSKIATRSGACLLSQLSRLMVVTTPARTPRAPADHAGRRAALIAPTATAAATTTKERRPGEIGEPSGWLLTCWRAQADKFTPSHLRIGKRDDGAAR